MICLFSPKPEPAILARTVLAACVAACVFAYGQTFLPNQEVRIGDLPLLGARAKGTADVLTASVEIIFRDQQVCCDKKSALGDLVQSADPLSLKDIGDKL